MQSMSKKEVLDVPRRFFKFQDFFDIISTTLIELDLKLIKSDFQMYRTNKYGANDLKK